MKTFYPDPGDTTKTLIPEIIEDVPKWLSLSVTRTANAEQLLDQPRAIQSNPSGTAGGQGKYPRNSVPRPRLEAFSTGSIGLHSGKLRPTRQPGTEIAQPRVEWCGKQIGQLKRSP